MAGSWKLTVRDQQATIVNLQRIGEGVIEQVHGVVADAGEFTLGRAREIMLEMGIFDTGHMYDVIQVRYSPEGLGFQVGWWPEDFTSHGLELYYIYVVLGTSKVGGRDPLTPAHDEMRDWIREQIKDAIARVS